MLGRIESDGGNGGQRPGAHQSNRLGPTNFPSVADGDPHWRQLFRLASVSIRAKRAVAPAVILAPP
jgi:hypothetical protein